MTYLEKVKARYEAATKGPWEWEYHEDEGEYRIELDHMVLDGSEEDGLPGAFDDREFIAHSREDMPWLVGIVERLEKMGSRLESHLKNRTDCCSKCFAEPCMQCSDNNAVLAEWAILLAELKTE